MKTNMETTISGYRIHTGYIGRIDNGKENGNDYNGLSGVWGLGVRVQSPKP